MRKGLVRGVQALAGAAVLALIVFVPLASRGQDPAAGSTAAEEAGAVSGGAESDLVSRYVWRGIAFSEGWVMQPSAWITVSDFTLSVWGNYVLGDEANRRQWNEVDFYFGYSHEWENFGLEVLYGYYVYPNLDEAPDTAEISLTLSYARGDFTLFTTHTFDVVEYDGAYSAALGVSYEREFNDRLEGAAAGYLGFASGPFNEAYLGLDKGAFNVAGLDLALTYSPVEWFYLRPHLGYSSLIDEDLREFVDDPDLLTSGLAFGVEF